MQGKTIHKIATLPMVVISLKRNQGSLNIAGHSIGTTVRIAQDVNLCTGAHIVMRVIMLITPVQRSLNKDSYFCWPPVWAVIFILAVYLTAVITLFGCLFLYYTWMQM